MNRAASCFFNLVTMLFVVLTVIVLVVVLGIAGDAMDPPIFAPDDVVPLPTAIFLPTLTPIPTATPSHTPSPTLSPIPTLTMTPTLTLTGTLTSTFTRTPTLTRTPTDTPTLTWTPTDTPPATFTPSMTPTNTLIPPTLTPTHTYTSTPSFTPTFSPTPTGPTPTPTSMYPFRVQPDSILLRENFANPAGCNWQGIAGQVITTNGEAVIGVQVRVRGTGIAELTTLSGTNQFYGPSGWEIVLGNQPVQGRYTVELWANGARVSPSVELVFPGVCQQNLGQVNFIMTRPYQ